MMKIKRIKPLSLAKVQGLMMFVFGILISLFSLISILSVRSVTKQTITPLAIGIFVFLPFLYAFIGFVLGLITAGLYNLIARRIGGIEVEVENQQII